MTPTREQMNEFMVNASLWSEWGWDDFGHHVTLESVCEGYLALLDRVERLEREKHGAYNERNRLVAALSKLWPSHLADHPADDLTWDDEWRTIVCIHSPAGQLTWHIKDGEQPLFAHLSKDDGHWDGHTTEQKYQRLESLAAPTPERTT